MDKLITDFTIYLRRNNKTKSTIIAYKKDISQLLEINPNKELINLTEEEIKFSLTKLQSTKALSAKTVSRKLNSIRTFYKFLETQGIIKNNPSQNISHPKFRNKKQRILSKLEYLELKEICRNNTRLFTMVELLLQTGIRISELSKIKLKDINLTQGNLTIEKNNNIDFRDVPLNNKIIKILKNYLDSFEFKEVKDVTLFTTRTGEDIEVRNIRSTIDRAISKAKIKEASVNDLRNTFIVYQLSNGMSILKLSKIVGHKSPTTTSKYTELVNKKYKPGVKDTVTEL